MTTKPPLHSEEMERAIIGCALIDTEGLKLVLQHLDPEWLYVEAHRVIIKIIAQHVIDDEKPDLTLVLQWLTSAGVLAQVGGREYLMQCMEAVSTTGHTQAYILEVRALFFDRAINRALLVATEDPSPENIDLVRVARESKDGANASGILSLKDCIPKVKELLLPNPKGMYDVLPWKQSAEYHNGMTGGDIMVIGARPRVGKTVIATQIGVNFARVYQEPVLIFTTEMSYEEMLQRLLAPISAVPGWKFRKRYWDKEGKDAEAINNAAIEMSKLPIFIVDKPSPTLATIRAAMAATKAKLVILDYIQVVNLEEGKGEGKPAAYERFLYGFKTSLRGLGALAVVLSQLDRETDKLTKRQSPQLSDLKGSGGIEQIANSVLLMHYHNKVDRDTKTEEVPDIKNIKAVEIIHAKHRTGKSDCSVQMVFDENMIALGEWNTDLAMKYADQVIKHAPKEKKNAKSKSKFGDLPAGEGTEDPDADKTF